MSLYELDSILHQLDERKSRFPNICSVWTKYIEIKKQKLEQSISDTKNMLRIIDAMETDMSHDAILLTFILMFNLTETANTT
jgi:uncharacterized protein (UPF0371 family)